MTCRILITAAGFFAMNPPIKLFPIVLLLVVPAGWVPQCGADIKEEFPEFFQPPPAAPPGPNGWELLLKLPEIPEADI